MTKKMKNIHLPLQNTYLEACNFGLLKSMAKHRKYTFLQITTMIFFSLFHNYALATTEWR